MEYQAQENLRITRWLLPYESHGQSEHGSELSELQWIQAEQKRIRFPTEIKERMVKSKDPEETELIKEVSLWRVNENLNPST